MAERLSPSPFVATYRRVFRSSLRIQGVLRVDAGMFQCMATSPAGSATATVRLAVLPPDDGKYCRGKSGEIDKMSIKK